jgi:hypothetical protein
VKTWLTRIRGTIGMGLTWAAGWVFAGVLIGVSSILLPGLPWEVFFEVFDAPLPALAIPGFVGGVVFSTVLGIAGRTRRFDELSLPRFAAWGALGGVLLSLVPGAMVVLGLAAAGGASPGLLQFTAAIVGPLALLGAGSAAGSLMLARKSEDRALLEASADVAEVGLTGDEARELLDSGT